MPPKPRPNCTIDDCDKPHLGHGFCRMHYMRWKRHGDPNAQKNVTPTQNRLCSIEGCEKKHRAKGYCDGHYQRVKTTGEPGPAELGEKLARPDACTFDGCDKLVRARLLCGGHYRQQRDGESLRPLEQYGPRGEGTVNAEGYRVISVRGKVWLEHRYLADLALREHHGRLLLSHEEIHHVNGDRLDNRAAGAFALDSNGRYRSGNLEIWSTRQPKGQAIADKLAYAREILALYGDTLTAAPQRRTIMGVTVTPADEAELTDALDRITAAERTAFLHPEMCPGPSCGRDVSHYHWSDGEVTYSGRR